MMQKHLFTTVRFFTLVCGMTALAGCGWSPESNVRASAQNATMLSAFSLKNLFGFSENPGGPVTMYDAMALGLHYNLESRLAAAPPVSATPESFTNLSNGIDHAARKHKQRAAQDIIRDVRSAYLRALADNDQSARIELASLLNVSNPDNLQFAQSAGALPAAPPDVSQLEELELLALTQRMEASDAQSLRHEALKTFPGIKEILDNKNFTEAQWADFSARFTPGLVRLFTPDLELMLPENKTRLETLRQQALSAAIMAQVHMTHARYLSAYQAEKERPGSATTALEIARGDFLDSLGTGIIPDNAEQMSVADLSASLQQQFETTGYLHLARLPAPADQPETAAPPLQNASFSPSYPRIPPAQKISFKKPAKQLPYAKVGLLNIPDRQLQTLLKAPISEP